MAPRAGVMTALDSGDESALRSAARAYLNHAREQQFHLFDEGAPVGQLIRDHSNTLDWLLKQLWKHFLPDTNSSLLAVGGYGRQELHPYSDIDLLILCEQPPDTTEQDQLSAFLTFLWDLGLDVGSAVRTPEQCYEEGRQDVTIATNLLEARLIIGQASAMQAIDSLWSRPDFWPINAFFNAKVAEQGVRREKVEGTLYQLEPNIKECPGGLRDIQTIYWIAKRMLRSQSLYELIRHHLITPEEFARLDAAGRTLHRLRFALHRYRGRREDRLLFDNQMLLAEKLHIEGETENARIERLMQGFYRSTRTVMNLNEILLTDFKERIFSQDHEPRSLNARFQVVDDLLDIKQDAAFEQNPATILEAFLLFTYHPELKGLRARTIRLIQQALPFLDETFHQDEVHKTLFTALLHRPHGVFHALKYMHKYGVLEKYIPQFQKITGRMQFNMFHAYPVDEHTLLVLRHIRRFFVNAYEWEFPTAHQIAQKLCRPYCLYLAGLFHDITKGDEPHSETGAKFARQWCEAHNLPKRDTALISWLVRNHLIFSDTAQKQDITDPEVIQRFAQKIKTRERLNYLYLLTLADVLSTSPDVWNDWKNALFLELYNETARALDTHPETPRNLAAKALQAQENTKTHLKKLGYASSDYAALWRNLIKTDFFARYQPDHIARLTQLLVRAEKPFVHLCEMPVRGATEIIIYTQDRDFLFMQVTEQLEKAQLSIMYAHTYALEDGSLLMLFYVLGNEGHPLQDDCQRTKIRDTLLDTLSTPYQPSRFTPRLDRKLRCFNVPTQIEFETLNDHQTALRLSTLDVPGLLARVAQTLVENDVRLHEAKIATVGEKAEDTFIISTRNDEALSEEQQQQLHTVLLEQISCR
jgi:[protein-PII] uridylyltransferase